ncbi:MAG: type IV pilus twitching motility protein PilT, partial [Candidatus Roizmanbacteria bacterium]
MDIKELLEVTITRNASDLHIVPEYAPTIRVNGELIPLTSYTPVAGELADQLFLPILSQEQKENLHVNREIDFGFNLGTHRFRVNIYYSKGALGGSFRLIPEKIKTIEELGLPNILHDLILPKQGFILVTGPTGEGKSTTLASMINELNTRSSKHILTIEDPIEYIYPQGKSIISQREVGQDTHSWQIALRSALREDPDVVLIGEMRDYETIQAALTIAETGHLVLSTVHTNSAAQTIDRILDVFPPYQQPQIRVQLASMLKAVVSQRLLPNIANTGRIPACEL